MECLRPLFKLQKRANFAKKKKNIYEIRGAAMESVYELFLNLQETMIALHQHCLKLSSSVIIY
jgi:hypothetical protein